MTGAELTSQQQEIIETLSCDINLIGVAESLSRPLIGVTSRVSAGGAWHGTADAQGVTSCVESPHEADKNCSTRGTDATAAFATPPMAVYFDKMAKPSALGSEVRETLARIDERTTWLLRFGVAATLCLSGWCTWLTNRVVSGPIGLAAIASSPVTEATVRKTKSLVEESRKNPAKPRISADLVRSVGLDMISASAGTNEKLATEAWGAAIDLLNYRSTLNAEMNPLPPIGQPRKINEFSFNVRLANPVSVSVGDDLSRNLRTFGDDVPIDQAARLEFLGSTSNSGRTMGPRVVVMAFPDRTVKIDGSWYKNVVVSNTKIEYSGGPVKLENVYFINCEFQMPNLAPARAMGGQMMAGASVSFDGTLLAQPATGRAYPIRPANFHGQSAMLALIR